MQIDVLIDVRGWNNNLGLNCFFQYLGQFVGLNFFPAQLGTGHGDELFMMFKTHGIPLEGVFTSADKATSKNLLKLWTDFAKTGNPTPDPSSTQWTRHDQKQQIISSQIGANEHLTILLSAKLAQSVIFLSDKGHSYWPFERETDMNNNQVVSKC